MQQNNNKKFCEWDEFNEMMDINLSRQGVKCKHFLQLIQECDKIISKILNRPLSYAYERPQDFVTAILITRTFRLCISAIKISLSGYPEVVPNIIRTAWEIGLWLFLIQKDPIGASLGFLLSGIDEEIKMMEHDINLRRANKENLGNLEKNLEIQKNYRRELENIICKHEMSVAEIRKRYGKLSPREVCKRFGFESGYIGWYVFMSGHIHERGFANDIFLDESDENVRKFILGPVDSSCVGGVIDALTTLISNLCTAAEIIGDNEVKENCKEIDKKFHDIITFTA
jgi:hypothetical protein